MEKDVLKFIQENNLISPGDKIVIGLSGGADSCALLRVLLNFRERLNVEVFAAHVNHNVRESANADEFFSVRLCEKLHVPLRVYSVDMITFARENKLTQEEAGRVLRYRAFNEAMEFFSATKTATAHNKNDQAETVLMRIVRGTGMAGLSGIKSKVGDIIRPLLSVSREQIERYLREIGIEQDFVTDPTNAQNDYSRNKIRNAVIPLLERELNPDVSSALVRLSEISAADDDFLEREAAKNVVKLDNREEFLTLHPAIRKRVVRIGYRAFSGTLKDLSEERTAAIIKLAENGENGTIELPGGVDFLCEYGKLSFVKREKAGIFNIPVTVGEIIDLKEAGFSALLSYNENFSENCFSKKFSRDIIRGLIFLRSREAGDTLFIAGVGTKRLSDYLSDKKFGKKEREAVPLLTFNGEIICVLSKDKRKIFWDKRYLDYSDDGIAFSFREISEELISK